MSIIQKVDIEIQPVLSFVEQPEEARYVTVAGSAGGFTIPDSSGIDDLHIKSIHAPGLKNGSLPVMFFRTKHTSRPTFSVRLNSTPLTQHTFTDDGPHSWHEIIPSDAIKPKDNELTLFVRGDGNVTFSDIVILYFSNELTVKFERPQVVSQT